MTADPERVRKIAEELMVKWADVLEALKNSGD